MTSVIVHINNFHIVEGEQDWTLDRLIDWVRANEPDEPPVPVVEERETTLVHV